MKLGGSAASGGVNRYTTDLGLPLIPARSIRMNDQNRVCPMIVLMLDGVRRVGVEEARCAVRAEAGEDAASTVRVVVENPQGMSYIEWRVGDATYRLGTSSEPYINAVGSGKVDEEMRLTEPLKWTTWEEVPPEDEACRTAWMSHAAWLYVDAWVCRTPPAEDAMHVRRVLRIASRFVDERCVLLWRWGKEPKQVALPTPRAIESLRAGVWPA